MRLADAADVAHFVAELQHESDRGLPLIGGALIDNLLADTLRFFFCENKEVEKLLDGATAPLGTFSSRTLCCYVLGLIDEHEFKEIDLIRKVRNEFAHAKHGTSFKAARIESLCSSLG